MTTPISYKAKPDANLYLNIQNSTSTSASIDLGLILTTTKDGKESFAKQTHISVKVQALQDSRKPHASDAQRLYNLTVFATEPQNPFNQRQYPVLFSPTSIHEKLFATMDAAVFDTLLNAYLQKGQLADKFDPAASVIEYKKNLAQFLVNRLNNELKAQNFSETPEAATEQQVLHEAEKTLINIAAKVIAVNTVSNNILDQFQKQHKQLACTP